MKYLFDTDHISILQRQAGAEFVSLSARIAAHNQSDLAFCSVNFHEQTSGCHLYLARARTSVDLIHGYRMLDRVLDCYATAQVLPFNAAAAAILDGLLARRLRVGTMDLRIAAIALSQGLTLLTRNVRDFGRVPALITEDWTV